MNFIENKIISISVYKSKINIDLKKRYNKILSINFLITKKTNILLQTLYYATLVFLRNLKQCFLPFLIEM